MDVVHQFTFTIKLAKSSLFLFIGKNGVIVHPEALLVDVDGIPVSNTFWLVARAFCTKFLLMPFNAVFSSYFASFRM